MVVKKVLVAMVVLALFAAGCGGSSDSEELAQVRAELDALREQSATTAAPIRIPLDIRAFPPGRRVRP